MEKAWCAVTGFERLSEDSAGSEERSGKTYISSVYTLLFEYMTIKEGSVSLQFLFYIKCIVESTNPKHSL